MMKSAFGSHGSGGMASGAVNNNRLTSVDGLMAPREANIVENMKANIDPRLAIWTIINVIVNVGAGVCWYKLQMTMPNSQLFTLHFSAVLYVIPLLLFVYIRARFYESIDEVMPHKVILMTIGASLAFTQFFGLFTTPHITQTLQTILVEACVPLVLILSIMVNSSRYRWHQYVSMLIGMAGIAVSLIPRLEAAQFDVSLPWELLYLAAVFAVSLQLVGQQWAYQDSPDMWVSYLVAWQTLGQALTISALAPFEALRGFGFEDEDVSDIPNHYWSCLKCLFRYQDDTISSDCSSVWPLMVGFILFGLMAIIANAQVVQLAEPSGSMYAAMVWTFCFTAYNIVLSWSWLIGDGAVAGNWYNYISLGVMSVSMIGIRWWSHTQQEEETRRDEEARARQARDKQVQLRRARRTSVGSNVQQFKQRQDRDRNQHHRLDDSDDHDNHGNGDREQESKRSSGNNDKRKKKHSSSTPRGSSRHSKHHRNGSNDNSDNGDQYQSLDAGNGYRAIHISDVNQHDQQQQPSTLAPVAYINDASSSSKSSGRKKKKKQSNKPLPALPMVEDDEPVFYRVHADSDDDSPLSSSSRRLDSSHSLRSAPSRHGGDDDDEDGNDGNDGPAADIRPLNLPSFDDYSHMVDNGSPVSPLLPQLAQPSFKGGSSNGDGRTRRTPAPAPASGRQSRRSRDYNNE